jgi:hypothetical protein
VEALQNASVSAKGLRPPEPNVDNFDDSFLPERADTGVTAVLRGQERRSIMTARKAPASRTLAARPDLDQLRRQAKELLAAFHADDADAVAEVRARYHDADRERFALHDAQLVLARSYGFESWPKLKAYVDGVTVRRLVEAVRANDAAAVESLIGRRPEVANMEVAGDDEHRAIHYAVLDRLPDMVRLTHASRRGRTSGHFIRTATRRPRWSSRTIVGTTTSWRSFSRKSPSVPGGRSRKLNGPGNPKVS